jgi:hypothetical protein
MIALYVAGGVLTFASLIALVAWRSDRHPEATRGMYDAAEGADPDYDDGSLPGGHSHSPPGDTD